MTKADTTADTTADERFEDRLERLEQIVARLEDDSVGLEEALELFEDGMRLAQACRERLAEVEQRVARLLEEAGADGQATAELDVETT